MGYDSDMATVDLEIGGRAYSTVWPGGYDGARVLEQCRQAMRGEPRQPAVQLLDLTGGGRLVVSWQQVSRSVSSWSSRHTDDYGAGEAGQPTRRRSCSSP